MSERRSLLAVLLVLGLGASVSRAEDTSDAKGSPKGSEVAETASSRAIGRGLAALAKLQEKDGHFGRGYPAAITGMAGLAILAGDDRPLENRALARACAWFREHEKEDGDLAPGESHWVHSHGFATLLLSEVYGKILVEKASPERFPKKEDLRATVEKATKLLALAQSEAGGWNYGKTAGGDEGSTTVCAVQALRSARNFGIDVDKKVLDRGFAYLKRMQNADGGFSYSGAANGSSMGCGTAGATATLVLMQKLDERVLLKALGFLETRKVESFATSEYGLFYSAMAMKVVGDEYGDHMPGAARWTRAVEDLLVRSQLGDGTWPGDCYVKDASYGTSLSVLALSCPRGKLSIFNRRAPRLPD